MTFQELDACIAGSGRRSIASALIAFILDALDDDGAYVFAHGQSLSGKQQLIYPCAP